MYFFSSIIVFLFKHYCISFQALWFLFILSQVLAPVVRRLPRRVQAEHRYFVYDNCCASHKSALRRFPHRVRHFTFEIDRTHFKNHSTCHSGYNIDEFPQLKNINSQPSRADQQIAKVSGYCFGPLQMGDLSQSPGVVLCQKKCQNEKEIKKKVDFISLICAEK